MSIRLSHSSIETYSLCARKYFLQNVEKLIPKKKSSALFIGVAFDLAFNDILLNHKKLSDNELIELGTNVFNAAWEKQEDRYLGMLSLPKNHDIIYARKDFEEGILIEEDFDNIKEYFDELDIENQTDAFQFFTHLRSNVQFLNNFPESSRSFYNYVNWLSIKRKAPYIIRAYVEQLLPHVDEVQSIQINLSTKDEEENELTGIADFVVKLKPGNYDGVEVLKGENIIADNKSSSRSYLNKSYGEGSVQNSSQLAKYCLILNEQGLNITKGSYFVFVKDLKQIKNKKCKSCGHTSTASHQKCNNILNKKRCNGEWDVHVEYVVDTKLVVEVISQETIQKAMDQVDSTISNIKAEKFEPNHEACAFQFGNACPYLNYCHNDDSSELIKVTKK